MHCHLHGHDASSRLAASIIHPTHGAHVLVFRFLDNFLNLRQQHADLFTARTDTMRSFFAEQDHLGVLNYVIACLDFMNIRHYCHD